MYYVILFKLDFQIGYGFFLIWSGSLLYPWIHMFAPGTVCEFFSLDTDWIAKHQKKLDLLLQFSSHLDL